MDKVTISLFHSLEKVAVPISSIQEIKPLKKGSIIQLPNSTLHIREDMDTFFERAGIKKL